MSKPSSSIIWPCAIFYAFMRLYKAVNLGLGFPVTCQLSVFSLVINHQWSVNQINQTVQVRRGRAGIFWNSSILKKSWIICDHDCDRESLCCGWIKLTLLLLGRSGLFCNSFLNKLSVPVTVTVTVRCIPDLWAQSVIIVFITLQNQSAPPQMTMWVHLRTICYHLHWKPPLVQSMVKQNWITEVANSFF